MLKILSSMFSATKVWLFSAIGLLVAGLGVAVKILSARNSRLNRKVETAEAKIEHAKAVIRADNEANKELHSRRADARNEIKSEGKSKELEDPNNNW